MTRLSMSMLMIGILSFIGVVQAKVISLTAENFHEIVNGETNVMVDFFAPWCSHCKTLAPEWDLVGDTFTEEDDVIIAKVDCDAEPSIREEMKIKGYPTIKLFKKDSPETVDYQGGRTAREIANWIRKQIKPNPVISWLTKTADGMLVVSGIQGVLDQIAAFLAVYGWYILFTSIILYNVWSSSKPWLKERANKRSLNDANRPERRDILDNDLRRIRERQQAAFLLAKQQQHNNKAD